MTTQTSTLAGALPVEFSSFVGRRTHLMAARASLGATRLLTLQGPGGVGKTRFAIRLAQSVTKLHPDGTWFIDLSGVTAAGMVADEVGRVLDLQAGHGDEFETVSSFFGSKRGLIVLDNCEQVVDESARLVKRILDDCPGMTVIATSRAALLLTAEKVFVVEPLEISDSGAGASSPAVTLFLERCAEVLPNPTPAELHTVAQICRRLDGLPLAIELAATRVKVLAPAEILTRLAEPLSLLSGGVRDVPDRQQTMRAAIAWSYELCTSAERAMWRQMSVFAGGWDLQSAEWMNAHSGSGDEPLEIVQSLLEKSVLTRRGSDGVVFFDMLDTVRAFGLEASSADELDRARTRHRDWYLKRLADLEADWYGPNQAHWLSLTRRELPNIRTALEFCIANGDAAQAATILVTAFRVVWQAHGRVDELRRWGLRILELGTSATPETSQLMATVGCLEVLTQSDEESGHRRLAQAQAMADRLGDKFSRVFVQFMRGSAWRDRERALADYLGSYHLQGGPNLVPARENLEEDLAVAHDSVGHTDIATKMRDKLVARAIRVGDSYETSQFLLQSGLIAARRRDFDAATSLLRQSLSLAQNLDNPVGLAQVEEALAIAAAANLDFTRAATLLGISHPVGDPAGAIAAAYPSSVSYRVDAESQVRRMLGQRPYETAYAKGKAWTTEEGIAYALGAQLPARPAQSRVNNETQLSAREGQVASLVGQGLSDKEIASRLVISRRTAEGHVAKSLTKLGFTSRTQLAAWTAREGITA
jgi:predicted ATPase/DNA-binding CsgD family transcriptional regulator